MRGSVAKPGALAFLVVLAACLDPAGPEPVFQEQRAVFSVLEVGSPVVRLLADEIFEGGSRGPLRGASGSVTSAGGAAALASAVGGPVLCFTDSSSSGAGTAAEEGCYSAMLAQPLGGSETVTLDMTLPDGRRVLGALTTPEPPQAYIPPDSQRVTTIFQSLPLDRLPIAIVPIGLDAAPGGERVDVVATVDRAFRFQGSGALIDPAGCTVEATTAPFRAPRLGGEHDLHLYSVQCLESGSGVAWDSLDLSVQVVSMDANYAGYANSILGSSSIDVERAGFGLDGAIGVFGAVATTVLPLRIVYIE